MRGLLGVLILLALAAEDCMVADASTPVAFSPVTVPRLWAIDDRAEYMVVTAKNWSNYYPAPPKDADFASCIYVVASLGTRPNPGYRVRIVRIAQEADRVEVSVEQLNPDPKGIYAQVLVNPIAVAEVKRKDLQRYPVLDFVFANQSGRQIGEFRADF